MATTPASAVRKQHVFVDVPKSPYPIVSSFSHKSAPAHALTSLTLKENAPMQINGGVPRPANDGVSTLKRKTSEHHISQTKKQKLGEPSTKLPAKPSGDISSNLPNSFKSVYCHQCSQRRDVLALIKCTSTKIVKGVENPCRINICIACLKNRYGEDALEIKSRGVNGDYTFRCPKCRDICNCRNCRKSKGLSPVGKIAVAKPKHHIDEPKTSQSQLTPKKTVEVFIATMPPKNASSKASPKPQSSLTKPTPKVSAGTKTGAKSKQKTLHQMVPQSLPVLKWTEMPTNLSLPDAQSRLQIREFVLRFASVMQPPISRALLAELDDLGCGSDDEEMTPWLSEACVRSIIISLLGMLGSLEGESQKLFRAAARDIRASGNSLTKIWSILAKLRDALSDDDAKFSFPDPLPLPASAVLYDTRTTRSTLASNNGPPNVIIGCTAQMIPVVEALIEAGLETPAVRDDLDDGVTDGKEMVRNVQKAVREENERWDAQRKLLEAEREREDEIHEKKEGKGKVKGSLSKVAVEIKLKREAHKIRIRDLEYALKLVTPGFAPRFTPLGTDAGGRTFWTASPGVVERKAALDFIASVSETKKTKARAHHAVDAGTPTEWSWFVAVWGKRIPAVGSTSTAEGGGVERWWAFSEPPEIRKLADWIRIDAGIDPDGESDRNSPLASLVRGLNDYAGLLEWRRKEDKYMDVG